MIVDRADPVLKSLISEQMFTQLGTMSKPAKPAPKHFAVNRQAQHLYHLLERFEAGVELTGTEVKSVREGKINLKDSYVDVQKGQAWLID